MNAYQGYKLSTIFDKMYLYLVLIKIVFERKGVKRVDPFYSTKLYNNKLD